jgi:hypothetical protein
MKYGENGLSYSHSTWIVVEDKEGYSKYVIFHPHEYWSQEIDEFDGEQVVCIFFKACDPHSLSHSFEGRVVKEFGDESEAEKFANELSLMREVNDS